MSEAQGNRRIARTVAAIMAVTEFAGWRPSAQAAQLPIPCVANSCGASSPRFVSSGNATATQVGNTLTVNQSSDKAILNWASFNVSADGTVQFQQPAATSIALNRIYQQSPSSIFGNVTANGQIYLVNPNGIIFGQTARVNAAGVIASSLGISDAHFNSGLLAPQILNGPASQAAALSAGDNTSAPVVGPAGLNPDGTPVPGSVVVQPGAQISTPAGRILLAAPTVTNGGTLSAPDGQVVLAAGQKVYLQASGDPALRGLIVEVDTGGTAENQLGGLLSADRGNVSMIGLAVNQNGRISATTAVSANGSVRLEAADTVTNPSASGVAGTIAATNSKGGKLELGPQSSIDIQPELSSTATTVYDPNNPLPLSQISLVGEQILMEGGSITAPGGTLKVVATDNPSLGVGATSAGEVADPNARIRVHAGTSIDLSGSAYELPMSANLLAIQLRSNELADDPTQRGGALQGKTVYVDVRTGTSIVGKTALQAAELAVPHTIGFWTDTGGTASFQSKGDVVLEQGASINVSGGQTTYAGGVLQTSQLVGANGKLYDIGTANPLLTYTGVLNPTFTASYNKWGVQNIVATPGLSHYVSGYVQGSSAGTVQFAAPAMVLDGTLTGHAVNGPYQRAGASVASGGTLILGLQGGVPNPNPTNPDYLTPAIAFTNNPPPIAIEDSAQLLGQLLQLPVKYLADGGFTGTQIYGNTTVTVPVGVPLEMLPGSSLLIDAPRIDVLSNIAAAGGKVQMESVLTSTTEPFGGRPGVRIGDGVTIDVRGQWTNDSPLLSSSQAVGPTLQDGGQIAISLQNTANSENAGAEVVLGNNVALRASGGGWVSSANKLTGGAGGKISIDAPPVDAALQIGSSVELDAYGVNGAAGGSFFLSAPRLAVAAGGSNSGWSDAQRVDDLLKPGGVLTIYAGLFANYGFSQVSLEATGPVVPAASSTDILTVQAGTAISASSQTLLLDPGYLNRNNAANINGFSHLVTLPEAQRAPSSISLSVVPPPFNDARFLHAGLLDLEKGSSVVTDPKGKITLVGVGGVYVDGTLRAPGGTITLQTQSPSVAGSPDPGYRPDLSIEIGPQGVLDVSGTLLVTPSDLGLRLGTVIDGGTINLFADRGTVMMDSGSVIDIAGASALLDVPTSMGSGVYRRYTVGSAGGVLSVRSPESISLLGNLQAAAGAGDYGDPAGGFLELDLTRLQARGWFQPPDPTTTVPLPSGPLVIQLVSDTSGMSASAPDSNVAILGVAQLKASGVDSLQLVAGDEVQFSSSTPLSLTRQAIFDAPVMVIDQGVSASVSANYVSLGDSQVSPTVNSLLPGTGTLSVQAQQIDLLGLFGFSGAKSVALSSAGDVTLRGVINQGAPPQGAMTVDGDISIDAARIYPATQTSFVITAGTTAGAPTSGNRVTITSPTTAVPSTPLSAGGALSIWADEIDSSGTLMAPFGTIDLEAQTHLNLQDGSITSVSALGATIPYGSTQLNGAQWIYNAPGETLQTVLGIPQRKVTLNAPNVSITSGAKVNLQGGGDLYAYEWVPGTGGTKDALTQTQNPGLYAVLPSLIGQYAPYDPQESPASGLSAGASIYLSGGGGLAAGFYPLLPARYALLPGAYLVKVETGYTNIVPGQSAALADGTPVVAGYQTFGTTGLRDGGYQGIAIWPGSYGRQLATYQDSLASTYFAAVATKAGLPAPDLPADAGQLSIAVDASLNIAGKVLGDPFDSQGKGALVDISATNLEVTQTAGAVTAPGSVGIAASVIDGWHVGQLILGGHSANADGSNIAVSANSVTVDSGVQLVAGQVVLVADQSIHLNPGSAVLSNSGLSGGAAPAQLPTTSLISLTDAPGTTPGSASGAALLAVSDYALPVVSRSGTASNPASIAIDAGSSVGSRGAIAIDAPGTVTLAGTLSGSGASWSLASSSIGFVGQGTSTDTMQVTSAVQSELGAAGAIRLGSLGAINLYTPVQLGSQSAAGVPTLSSLILSAQSLNNLSPNGASTFTAKTLTVEGAASGPQQAPPVSGSGTMAFNATEFDVGPGTIAISGVANTQVNASSAFVGMGIGGLLTSGDLSITAPVLTSAITPDLVSGKLITGSTQISASGGTLTINALSGASPPPLPANYLGGELDFSADTIRQSGAVIAPAGIVTMTATHDISLAAGAAINTSGPNVAIAGQTVGAEGGRITLTAGGNLSLAGGSSLSASSAGDAPAGKIQLTAGGAADIAATAGLQAQAAAAGAQGGQFVLDAGSLVQGLTTLSSTLQSGGFGKQVNIRARTGDLTLSSGQITSNLVTLTADTGAVDIGGTINAPNADVRGEIQLFGGQSVVLEGTGQLHADTTGGAGVGGNIELGTGSSGSVNLKSGSVVSATGPAAAGTLLIRAPLVPGGQGTVAGSTDIAVAAAGSDLSRLRQIVVEPVITESATTAASTDPTAPDASDYARVVADVTSQMNGASANIANRLNPNGSLPLVIRPAVDLVQSGDLNLSTALDLRTWRFNDQPVDLTVRATGSINVMSTIQDGFKTVKIPKANGRGTITTVGMIDTNPDGTPYDSASIRLVAGADPNSPNPFALATVASRDSGKDLTIAGGTAVQTGTGEIDLVASRDITIGDSTGSAEVYTAGRSAAAAVALNSTSVSSKSVFNFPTAGGNVVVDAGRNIIGTPVAASQLTAAGPSVTTWQVRQGGAAGPAQWGVDLAVYSQYGWNVATLGGGDVSVNAGGSINTLSAAAADSYVAANSTTNTAATHLSSGGLAVTAGGDIGSGQFFAADGTSLLNAGGAFSAISPDGNGGVIGSLIALSDAQISVEARLGIVIDAVVNPTTMTQLATPRAVGGYFSYSGDSALTLQSTTGDVNLRNDSAHVAALLGGQVANGPGGGNGQYYPATLRARSLSQDVTLPGGGTLFPSDNGQLELIAARDITETGSAFLEMSDVSAAGVPTVESPGAGAGVPDVIGAPFSGFQSGRHAGDSTPAVIVAGRDIGQAANGIHISVPKATDIVAGRDIMNLQFFGQNLNPTDLTLISAGRDYIDMLDQVSAEVRVGGPGKVDVLAGRDVNLGLSMGIDTTGNLINPNLPTASGADLTVMAGLGQGADYGTFLQKIVAPDPYNQGQLIAYIESLNGQSGLSFTQAETAFNALSLNQQRDFLNGIFFHQLLLSGQEANTLGFARGYAAIDALFPNSRTAVATGASPYAGNLDLTFSRIYTLSGGTISLFAPGGGVNVGLANPPASISLINKKPSDLGIVAQGLGDVDIYTKNDVLVNASRIFTLGGGNILIWSDEGNIDAGRGAKSSTSAPPPQLVVDSSGTIKLNFEGAVSGSGIRTIQVNPTVAAGNVELIAPEGTVNAGDAGIGAAGNITIAAQHVLGLDNIQFGGQAVGVPAQVSDIGVALSGVANVANSATNSATNSADEAAKRSESASPLAQAAISWLDVFVTGLGEENCRPDDVDCIKRQTK